MKKRAFTLVEALVVIAIIGMLVALILPAVSAIQKSKATPSPMRQVAYKFDTYQVWEFIHDGNKYLVLRTSGGGGCIIPALPPKAEKEPGHAE